MPLLTIHHKTEYRYNRPVAFGDARYVLRYLGRYTHRVGISNQRMVSMTDDGHVTFRTKNGKTVTLTADDFQWIYSVNVVGPPLTAAE